MLRFPAGFVGVQMRGLILWLLFVVFGAVPAFAERYALVVGIDRYTRLEPLRKATNDARAVAKTLESAGFGVTLSLDPDADALYDKLASFTAALRPGDEVVVYFAGHGVEVEGRNWLLPADMAPLRPGDEVKLRRAALATDDLLAEISARGPQVTLMILDACRDNPFPRQGTRSVGNTRGLARLEAPRGSYVIYSAGAGQTALDRLGEGDANPNSVFTRALLPRLAQPGLSIRDLAQQVRLEVDATARSIGHDQFPAIYDQLAGDFVLAGAGSSGLEATPRRSEASSGTPNLTEDEFCALQLQQIHATNLVQTTRGKVEALEAILAAAKERTCLEARDTAERKLEDALAWIEVEESACAKLRSKVQAVSSTIESGQAKVARIKELVREVDPIECEGAIRWAGRILQGYESTGASAIAPISDGFSPSQLDQPRRPKPRPGIMFENAQTHAARLGLTLVVDGGVRVAAITPGSMADRQGIKVGDYMKETGNSPLLSPKDFDLAVDRLLANGGNWILVSVYDGFRPRFVSLAIK
jgi:uncharacterized caspase-like protein